VSRSESLSRVKWCRSRRGLCVFWRFAEEASRLLCLAGDDKPRQGHQSGAVESRSERQIHDPASYFRGFPPYIENDARSLGWFGGRLGTGRCSPCQPMRGSPESRYRVLVARGKFCVRDEMEKPRGRRMRRRAVRVVGTMGDRNGPGERLEQAVAQDNVGAFRVSLGSKPVRVGWADQKKDQKEGAGNLFA